MTIGRVGSQPVVTSRPVESTRAASTAAAPAATGHSSASSFVGSTKSAATSSAVSNNSEVNDILASIEKDGGGLITTELFKNSGSKELADKMKAWVKDHPDATKEEFMKKAYDESFMINFILGNMEKAIKECTQKNAFAEMG